MFKHNNFISFFKNNCDNQNEHPNYLGNISIHKDVFKWNYNNGLVIKDNKDLDDMDWIVIGKTKFSSKNNQSYFKLREGDIIKFGKVMFKLREIKNEILNQNTLNQLSESNNNNNEHHNSINEDNDKLCKQILIINSKNQMQKSCRICLLEEETNDNPLINICGCIGSVRFIHLDCLRQWLRSKVTIKKNDYTTSYFYKAFQCELCKFIIPGNTILIYIYITI